MADNNKNQAGNQINQDEMCMLCGRSKEVKNLVCYYVCYKLWQEEQIASVANNTEFLSILDWTLKRAEALASSIKEELSKAQTDLNDFKEAVRNQAYEDVKEKLGGKTVEHGFFSEMLEARRQKLWEEGKGDKLYGRLKCLEYRVANLPGFVKALKEKVALRDQELSDPENQDSMETDE